MCRLAKGVLNLVLPEDPGVTLTSPPKLAFTKGRKKTNSTKRDKSHWEHMSIAHRKIQKSSGSGSGTGSCNCKNVICDGNCGYRVVADFVFGDKHQWPKDRRRMLYESDHSTNLYVHLVGSEFETPDSLYIIANAFNPCVILIAQLGSTTVLLLYSYLDCQENMRCNRSSGRLLHATREPVRILNPWISAGEKPRHVIICAPRWRYSRKRSPLNDAAYKQAQDWNWVAIKDRKKSRN
ncbi:hypothetical protein M9H77_29942 [Catharanthus roseus]|uniref:Uncharacterized protein n=1 Tax=Catharanthus roseus TaxID=4058 RepID=A0ACB9ZWW5_CATRO|nr:hypothetical protein M9H77_29942 [Catharanthus roseus]